MSSLNIISRASLRQHVTAYSLLVAVGSGGAMGVKACEHSHTQERKEEQLASINEAITQKDFRKAHQALRLIDETQDFSPAERKNLQQDVAGYEKAHLLSAQIDAAFASADLMQAKAILATAKNEEIPLDASKRLTAKVDRFAEFPLYEHTTAVYGLEERIHSARDYLRLYPKGPRVHQVMENLTVALTQDALVMLNGHAPFNEVYDRLHKIRGVLGEFTGNPMSLGRYSLSVFLLEAHDAYRKWPEGKPNTGDIVFIGASNADMWGSHDEYVNSSNSKNTPHYVEERTSIIPTGTRGIVVDSQQLPDDSKKNILFYDVRVKGIDATKWSTDWKCCSSKWADGRKDVGRYHAGELRMVPAPTEMERKMLDTLVSDIRDGLQSYTGAP